MQSSLEHAARTIPSTVYDAVVLDVMLPGMDGCEILRRMRENLRTPVLVLTAVVNWTCRFDCGRGVLGFEENSSGLMR